MSWENREVDRLFRTFAQKHRTFYSIEYKELYDAIYATHFESTGTVQRLVGRKQDIVKMTELDFTNHLMNVLHDFIQPERNTNMTYNEEERQQQARKKGEKVARWLLALNPNIPQDILLEMSMELAKLFGYGGVDEAMEFAFAIQNKFRDYQQINTSKLIEQ